MKEISFKDCTLDQLDDLFGLAQIEDKDCKLLERWLALANQMDVSDFEEKSILKLQKPLKWGGTSWNEFELESKFISPLIMEVEFDDRQISYFLERYFKATIGGYELSGTVDGVIATGFRNPKIPFFCMSEYKKSMDNAGRADAQALAAMLVAREMNENDKPIYGLYIVGLIWHFMVLEDNQYCISKGYKSEDEEVFTIFKLLKALKHIIKTELLQKEVI